MKKILSLVLAIVCCFSLISCASSEVPFSDDSNAIQVASNSVIMLSCYDKGGNLYATGSAFAAFEEGVFITNFHVIEGEVYTIKAQMETGSEFSISSVVAYDEERDLAILRTEAKTGLEPLPLGKSSNMEKGEKVIAIGSPLGLINTLSTGLYSGTLTDGQVFLQFSAAISHGSSGGALFNDKGEVVGITSASYTEGQNLNLAIPIEDALELWDNKAPAELSVPEFYDLWDHIQECSVSYILSHKSEFHGGVVIRTEGYVFIDPYSNNSKKFYLIDTISDFNALCDALEELMLVGGPLDSAGKKEAHKKIMSGYSSDDPIMIRQQAEVRYTNILDSAFYVASAEQAVSLGDYIVVEGVVHYLNNFPHLKDVIIIEKK